jgi:NADH-quinone oxidoreductase subunit M
MLFDIDFLKDSVELSLSIIVLLPLFASLLVVFTQNIVSIRTISIVSSGLVFIVMCYVWAVYDLLDISSYYSSLSFFGLHWLFKLDGLSLSFVGLTAFLMPICFLSVQGTVDREKEYILALLVLHAFMEILFLVQNILLFYIFFESVLIPMYFIIGALGSRLRRIYASYQLLLYTIFGSIPMLLSILFIYNQTGSFDLVYLRTVDFGHHYECILWLAFFLGFAVKVPMFPFHIWLPEAHVEAPTAGSVILAGVLLKLGTYGFVRFLIPLFPYASDYFSPIVYILSIMAIIYTSLTTLRQVDLKKIVAYSSVAHMGYVTMGLFSFSPISVEGSILIMLSHGFVASSLFLCIGVVYDRYKTRIYTYYSGLVHMMPVYITILLIFTMANLGLPGTSSFPGEFMITLATIERGDILAVVASFGTILSAAYSLWMFNRIAFGASKSTYLYSLSDINFKEFLCLFPMVIAVIFLGVYPEILIKLIHPTSVDIIQLISVYGCPK